jgi:effector-binding domain-containing protein
MLPRKEVRMTELLHPASHEPGAGPGRPGGTPEIHRLAMRETAVIAIEVTPDEIGPAVGAAIMEVEAAMRTAGVDLGGPPFARYLAFEPRIKAEIGFPVLRPAPDVGRVVPGRLPGGRVASIVHVGPYDTLERTYGELIRWLAEMGIHPAGALWEVYWSDPEEEPDPATWRTEIFAPIE